MITIDKRKGLLIGAAVSGLIAVVSGIKFFSNKKSKNQFAPTPISSKKMEVIVVQEGRKRNKKPRIKLVKIEQDDDEVQVPETESLPIAEESVLEPESVVLKCFRCNSPLDTHKICFASNYTLFCSETMTGARKQVKNDKISDQIET